MQMRAGVVCYKIYIVVLQFMHHSERPKLKHLKTYRAIKLITRHGSIRKAAEYMAISPSALNRSIQAFEDEIGVEVFERVASGVRLSTAGELLFPLIDAHLIEFDGFGEIVGDLKGGIAGELRVSLSSDLASGSLIEMIADFRAQAPKVTVDIRIDDTLNPLAWREVDLAITTHPMTDDRFTLAIGHRTALLALCAEGETLTAISDLERCRLIVPPDGTGTRGAIAHLLRKHRLEPKAITSVPGLWPNLRRAAGTTGPDVQILPALTLPQAGAAPSHQTAPLDLGHVQISALQRAQSPLPRVAQNLLIRLQAYLDQAETL